MNPRVLIIILCYNHGKFITEVLQAWGRQTYSNLSFIVSDDGSVDDTFSKVVAAAKLLADTPYLRRNNRNLGLSSHLRQLINPSLPTCDLVIIASGDDVPKSYRVERLVSAWQDNSTPAITSSYVSEINSHGQTIWGERSQLQQINFPACLGTLESVDNYLIRLSPIACLGAANMYRRDFLLGSRLPRFIPYEDHFYYFRSLTNGGYFVLAEELVEYRVHSSSLSHSTKTGLRVRLYGMTKDISRTYSVTWRELVIYFAYTLCYFHGFPFSRPGFSLLILLRQVVYTFLKLCKLLIFLGLFRFRVCAKLTQRIYSFLSHDPHRVHKIAKAVDDYLKSFRISLSESRLILLGANFNATIFEYFFLKAGIQLLYFSNPSVSDLSQYLANSKRGDKDILIIATSIAAETQAKRAITLIEPSEPAITMLPRGITNRIFRMIF